MKFVMTLNLPSFKGNSVQQIVATVKGVENLNDLSSILDSHKFIIVEQHYQIQHRNGERTWQYKGLMILNTDMVGKAQEFMSKEDEII